MRWDLIEKFSVLKKGSHAEAVKSFLGGEDFFQDHFPGKPRVPEPLFVEMIAQVGGVLLGLSFDFKKEVILAKISSAKFLRAVVPPCSLLISAHIEEEREEGAWIVGKVEADGECVAESKILLVTIQSLEGNGNKRIVFNDHFLKHFDVYAVAKLSEVTI